MNSTLSRIETSDSDDMCLQLPATHFPQHHLRCAARSIYSLGHRLPGGDTCATKADNPSGWNILPNKASTSAVVEAFGVPPATPRLPNIAAVIRAGELVHVPM